ncbi:YgdI/YgdR family lipoprotein, partial [Escherichia coli]|nr:YgdI/YgdR family lipoprotein [Escherichia coli]
LVSYHYQQGNAMQINRDDLSQIIERLQIRSASGWP